MRLTPLKENRVAGLKRSYVKCRAYGHAWDDVEAANVRPLHGFWEALRCLRCTSQVIVARDVLGKAISRSYSHPVDYRTVTAMSRAEAHVWLNEHVRRRRGRPLRVVA